MLIFQIKRIISSEKKKWFNYVATLFFFFCNAKDLGRTTIKGEKKKRLTLLVKKKVS